MLDAIIRWTKPYSVGVVGMGSDLNERLSVLNFVGFFFISRVSRNRDAYTEVNQWCTRKMEGPELGEKESTIIDDKGQQKILSILMVIIKQHGL